MKAFLLLFLWTTALVGAAQSPHRAAPGDKATKQAQLEALLKQEKVPGMQLVYSQKATATVYNLGLRKSGSAEAVEAGTTFQAASLGKVVLAYLTLRLCDQGVLKLDTPLLTYYAYPRLQQEPRAANITARMVLAHTTGLPNWAENPLSASWSTTPLHLRYAPDSCWNYSGEAYVFLQKTLEHLTGKPFNTLAQQEVFAPLQMAHSSFVWRDAFTTNASFGHDAAGKPTQQLHFTAPYGAFTLLSTASDYNRFLQAVLTGKGLAPATAKLLLTPANPANRCRVPPTSTDAAIAWAYGVGLATTSHGPAIWQWGDNGDFQGFFMAFPGKQESIVFLTNSANGLKMTDKILQLFLGSGQYQTMQWLAEDR
ncbi:serine hydrolase domain-containing protein [Hymenobacter crusticola]|uniref:Beta-lactamase-related domain-containing protein n=1 Tax=Hymenobacter crusticola TaxID=1770526 RepID=A0A243W9S9_9BACT|nr:serine hydrolase domain-containing protein [Hymenobacter crusticola]OUJ72294.1 hypothetical protein BXP70_18725 [Hymenobacter crusticola]